MVPNRVQDRLHHILEAIDAIEQLTAGKTLAEYRNDPDLAAAVERYIERLSEASRHLPDTYKQKHPSIDWRGVASIGNILRHVYEQVIDEEIWQAVTNDLGS
ncbi:MAG: HepT-like ribonuclease domain-containing protein [Pseudomonadota bacterium]|nr:HepT-like ribonuclease domain-containing protein [Pseudomonadota bacterium]